MSDEVYEIQVKVPVCVTIRVSQEDAESMYHDELCEVVDSILIDAENQLRTPSRFRSIDGKTCAGREITVLAKVSPHWDHVPVDECELTMSYDGLFPERD